MKNKTVIIYLLLAIALTFGLLIDLRLRMDHQEDAQQKQESDYINEEAAQELDLHEVNAGLLRAIQGLDQANEDLKNYICAAPSETLPDNVTLKTLYFKIKDTSGSSDLNK